jgi:hypothetical protein
MVENKIVRFILQFLIAAIACFLFRAIGLLLLHLAGKGDPEDRRGYLGQFYPLFHGITFCVSLYAVIRAHFVTIHVFILVFYMIWLGAGRWRKVRVWGAGGIVGAGAVFSRWREVLLGCVLFTAVFHFLPDGENTQNDSFFYLKIAESLNSTGQENLHTYNNAFDPAFHGVEPYHYVEMWLTALLLPVTRWIIPGVETFRFVVYTILSVCMLYGLWGTYEVLSGRRADRWARLFGFAFLFFLPDVLRYVPFLERYLLYNFENSYLERINFRTVYLYLLTFLLCMRKGMDRRVGVGKGVGLFESILYFVCLSVASYLCFLVLFPSVLAIVLFGLVRPGEARRPGEDKRKSFLQMGALTGCVGLLFWLFYNHFSGKAVGGFYHSSPGELLLFVRRHWAFILFSIATSLAYILAIVVLYTGYFWLRRKSEAIRFCRENDKLLTTVGVMVVISVTLARMLAYQDNAYQIAFLAYMLGAWVIFACWSFYSGVLGDGSLMRGRWFRVLGIAVMLAGYVLFKIREGRAVSTDIVADGNSFYGNRHYSNQYIGEVTAYVQGREGLLGGWLADSSYYKGLDYFGLRNPNVDFPPINYIIAGRVAANYEFCLSDSAAILADVDPTNEYEVNYLDNAIKRSGFYVYRRRMGLQRSEALHRFIRDRHLQFLIVSGKASEAEIADLPVGQRFSDPATGEVFLVLGNPGRD